MRFLQSLLLPFLICVIPALAMSAMAIDKVTLAGKFKAVEQYEINVEEYEANSRTARKYLTYVELSNDLGKVVESWELTNDADGPYYTRHVFTHDRFGNTITELTYKSSHAAAKNYFSTSRSPKGIKIVPELADSLYEVMIKEYNKNGDLVELRWADGDGQLKQKETFVFATKGKQSSSRNVKGDGTIICESISVYLENGQVEERTMPRCEIGNPGKIITRRDSAGRDILEEQYSIRSHNAGDDKESSLVLTSRAITTYSGEFANVDWTIWNSKGEPQQRLLIVGKSDDEISRKEFTPNIVPDGDGDAAKLSWVPAEEEIRDYQYDKAGNLIKLAARQRPTPNKPFHYTQIIERVVTYF